MFIPGGMRMFSDQKPTVQTYNIGARTYEGIYQRGFDESGHEDAERFVSLLPGPKILDAGCGPGIFLDFFREKRLDALGIDLSESFLDICAEKGLNVRKMDMETPILYPYSFDGIWASMSVLHVPKARVPKLVQTWAKLLKPNGVLFVSLKEGTKEGVEADTDFPPHERWISYFEDNEVKALFGKKFDLISEHHALLPSGRTRLKYFFRVKPVARTF